MLNEKLKKIIASAQNSSGIYKFLGLNDEILYIGKAKNLKKRLTNYAAEGKLCARISRMTSLAQKIETIQTKSDLEAILLEHNLIKKHKPKFNILLKDDKTFPLIAIDKKHEFGAISKHRGVKKKDFHYFGPFASALDVNRVIDVLKKSFLLRSCSDLEFASRKKPCLEYQIKRCSGPCVGLISKQDYKDSIAQALEFLNGKSSKIQSHLAQKMNALSADFEYEKAAAIRDKIKSLSSIQAGQNINLSEVLDLDAITLVAKENKYCAYISFFRGGNNYGSAPHFYNIGGEDFGEFLEEFLGQFYLKQDPPSLILLNLEIQNHDLMEDFLSEIAKFKVKILTPQKGDKARIIANQEQIAQDVLKQHIDKNLSDKKLLLELKEAFDLPKIPERIEVYDNSHTSTQNAVGAMICAGLEGFIKSGYRKFNISFDESENRDDTAMMKEVLTRRFKDFAQNLGQENLQNQGDFSEIGQNSSKSKEIHLQSQNNFVEDSENLAFASCEAKNENPDQKTPQNQKKSSQPQVPDLVIIDGGLPQLSAAREIWSKLNLSIPLICMAKGENRNAGEETYFKLDKKSQKLPKGSALAFYLQRLRDEAHRFAIMTHRAKRSKSVTKSGLDEIDGIGAKRKKLLLNHFGSFDKVKQASIEDLSRAPGINQKIAKQIWESLQN